MKLPAFTLLSRDPGSRARTGVLQTAHGFLKTPVFMPVATSASVKAISQEELMLMGARGILANTYHLYLRPGADTIRKLGGLHRFMNYRDTILTDSGGYQVFSLADRCKIEEEGVVFKSHIDGSLHRFTPGKVIELQSQLGSDIWTCLDVCPPYPCEFDQAEEALRKTMNWAEISKQAYQSILNSETNPRSSLPDAPLPRAAVVSSQDLTPMLFGILQGSFYPQLRKRAAEHLLALDFDGIALGGFSVGEPKEKTFEILEGVTGLLPETLPRYLMGVGTPEDIWEAVRLGVDMFDCVWPTRNARNGQAMTSTGKIYVKNAVYKEKDEPLDPDCPCLTCRSYSKAYLCHLYRSKEILSARLLSLHNLYFLVRLTRLIQQSIEEKRFDQARKEFLEKYKGEKSCSRPPTPSSV